MTAVVLCASFPAWNERGDAVAPYHLADIASAAATVAEAVLRSGAELVFGAHPTISPIVLQTANLLKAGRQVRIFQSDFFEDRTTGEIRRLIDDLGAAFHPIEAGVDLDSSLTAMRRAMFEVRPQASFFCGGMDGLTEEFALAGQVDSPRFLITKPGGMAAILARQHVDTDAADAGYTGGLVGDEPVALVGRAYGSLVLQALERAGLRKPQATGPFEAEIYQPEQFLDTEPDPGD